MGLLTRPTDELLKRLVFLGNTRGIIPNPVTATRIDKYSRHIENATDPFYTVGGSEKLFISSAWISIRNDSAAGQYIDLYYRDVDDLNPFYIFSIYGDVNNADSLSNQYFPAMEVPAGYDICLHSPLADIWASGGFFGWIEVV